MVDKSGKRIYHKEKDKNAMNWTFVAFALADMSGIIRNMEWGELV